MAGKLMSQVFNLKLSSAQRLVLLAMADYARIDDPIAYPSKRTIAWKTDMSERHVQRIFQQLKSLGLLVPITDGKGGRNEVTGRGIATVYRINLAAGEQKPPLRTKEKGDEIMSHNTVCETKTENLPDVWNPTETPDATKGDICDTNGDKIRDLGRRNNVLQYGSFKPEIKNGNKTEVGSLTKKLGKFHPEIYKQFAKALQETGLKTDFSVFDYSYWLKDTGFGDAEVSEWQRTGKLMLPTLK